VAAAVDFLRLEVAMTWLRSNADLALMAFALAATSLAYAVGAFVVALALHAPRQLGWSAPEMIAVGLYPLGWIGLGWSGVELWRRWTQTGGSRT
jgi:hypothetical protein